MRKKGKKSLGRRLKVCLESFALLPDVGFDVQVLFDHESEKKSEEKSREEMSQDQEEEATDRVSLEVILSFAFI